MKINNFEVRPCPYCGSNNLKIQSIDAYWISCCDCWAQGPDEHDAVTAVLKWNSVYPDLDNSFEEKRLVSYIKENDKKIYHGSDIREAMNDILKLRTEVNRLTNRINAILALGGPDNDN